MTLAQIAHRAKVGSIGGAAISFDSRNNRVKGFSSRLKKTRDCLQSLFEKANAVERNHPAFTRTTVRAFVRTGLVEDIRGAPLDYNIEAVVPVDNALEGYSMVYFGRNHLNRMFHTEVFAMELGSVGVISCIEPVGRAAALSRTAEAGFTISRLTNPSEQDVNQLLKLYNEAYQLYTFEINADTIRDILNNGNVVLVARAGDGGIASSLVAEHCSLQLESGRLLDIYELSDYATFRSHRGNGLITAMQIEIVEMLREMPSGREAIIYAEDRAAWKAVNISSVKAGLRYCGTLPQHCLLVSDRDFDHGGEYEDLNVFAAPPGAD